MMLFKMEELRPEGMDDTNYFWSLNYKGKTERPLDRAFISVVQTEGGLRGILHDYVGPGFDYYNNADSDNFTEELVHHINEPGTWVFEGAYRASNSHTPEEGLVYDTWLEGEPRILTTEEWVLYQQTGTPWDPDNWGQPWTYNEKGTDMRKIHDHETAVNAGQVTITVEDEPGPGGANHHYVLEVQGGRTLPQHITFQKGAIKEVGVNGITNEALLAVVIDRMRSFQSGDFACEENAVALGHLQEALKWLKRRTNARVARGVEGKEER